MDSNGAPPMDPHAESRGTLGEVLRYFFRLGIIAFGGPAAHIAIMRRELVVQRKWLTDQEFVDHLGVTNLIPGPNSTELTMHMGAKRAGMAGLWVAGAAFIIPAVVITLFFAWLYVEYGDTPTGTALIYGIQPIILAVIIQAAWGLRGTVFKGIDTVVLGVLVAALALSNLPFTNEAVLVVGSGVLLLLWRLFTKRTGIPNPAPPRIDLSRFRRGPRNLGALFLATPAGYALPELFFVFLKIGAVLYGSGYVLIAFIQADLVDARGWITEQQLVDAIAVGQFTPGPVFSTATFVGYLIDGVPGALAATAGIFLPSFVFVALTHPLVPRLRQSPWASGFLDGVNTGALALMLVVCLQLANDALDDWFAVALFIGAAFVLVRFSPNSALLIAVGAVAGLAHWFVTSG